MNQIKQTKPVLFKQDLQQTNKNNRNHCFSGSFIFTPVLRPPKAYLARSVVVARNGVEVPGGRLSFRRKQTVHRLTGWIRPLTNLWLNTNQMLKVYCGMYFLLLKILDLSKLILEYFDVLKSPGRKTTIPKWWINQWENKNRSFAYSHKNPWLTKLYAGYN